MRQITGAILIATSPIYAFLYVWTPGRVFDHLLAQNLVANVGLAAKTMANAHTVANTFAFIGIVVLLLGLYFLFSKDRPKT